MSAGTGTVVTEHDGDRPLIAKIAAHSARVRKGNHRCSLSCCPHCARTPEQTLFFRRHALRQRQFRVIDSQYVHTIRGLLARWRCPFCRRTFTDYPTFALPYKRYVISQLAPRALQYVEIDGISYRKGVLKSNLPIFHWGSLCEDTPSFGPGESALAHTTLYHWISTLGDGSYLPSTNECERQGREFAPAEWKYTTQARREVLLICHNYCLALVRPI